MINGSISNVDILFVAIRNEIKSSRFDINRDGLVDLLDRDAWVHDRKSTWLGDTNLDGEFDSSDMIMASSSGQYEDTIIGSMVHRRLEWRWRFRFGRPDRRLRRRRLRGGTTSNGGA